MNKQLLFFLPLIVLFECECKNSATSSKTNRQDSLAIIYTKDKWSIVRPKWDNLRHFAVTAKIMNTAEVYSYKDFVVEVNYKSETGTLLEKKTYTLHTSIGPQKVEDFDKEIEDEAPQGTNFQETTWRLLSATKYIITN